MKNIKKQPIYQINLQKLKENYNNFCQFGEVFFPVKTNSNQIILNKLLSLGSGFECDCIEHIKKIYNKNTASKIIYSNVAKTQSDIMWAIKHKIIFYTVDDEESLNLIISLAKQHKFNQLKINVRINVYDIFKQEFEAKQVKDSRLGASVKTCQRLLEIINNTQGLKIFKGISFYVQAEFHDDENILTKVSQYVAKHFGTQHKLNWLNIGGGSSVGRILNSQKEMLANLKKLNVEKFILEPGRFMVGDVEDLYIPVNRAIDADLNGGEKICSLAVGIYHGLLDLKLHNRKFSFNVLTPNEVVPLVQYNGAGKKLVLRGPTADSSDLLGIFKMPKTEINNNTIFVVKNIGAYAEVFNSEFSGGVKPKFVVK